MLNNEINEEFVHAEEEMPQHEAESSEWIVTTESRVKSLARGATEWVKSHPKTVIGAILGLSAIGGGITFYVFRSRRTSALAEFAAAMRRFH
jgi:hypothetical protein